MSEIGSTSKLWQAMFSHIIDVLRGKEGGKVELWRGGEVMPVMSETQRIEGVPEQ